MKDKSSMKSWIMIAGIILVALVAYYFFFANAPLSTDAGTLQAQSGGNVVGAQVLTLLNQIQSLRINTTLFKSAAFQSLQDYSVQVPPQNIGRPNPFAPLPGVKSPFPTVNTTVKK